MIVVVLLSIIVIRESSNKMVIGYYQTKVEQQKHQIEQLVETCKQWEQIY